MTRLVLTADDPPVAGEGVEWLGPWCLSDAQLLEHWRAGGRWEPMEGRVAAAAAFTARASEWLLTHWVETLNQRHGRQYSRRWWGLLLRAWLITLCDLSFDKYVRLRARAGVPLRIRVWPAGRPFAITDTRDFLTSADETPLTHFVASHLVRAIADSAWQVEEWPGAARDSAQAASRRDSARSRARRLRLKHWASVAASVPGRVLSLNVYGLGYGAAARLSAGVRTRAAGRRPHVDDAPAVRSSQHQSAVDAFVSGGFGTPDEAALLLNALESLSTALLPENLDTGFTAFEASAFRLARYVPRRVDTVVCGPVLGGDDEGKAVVAALVETRGARLVVTQHGGCYGMLETYSFVTQTDYRCGDEFFSWGWDRHAGCLDRATPVPAPLLATLTRRTPTPAVVLVGTNVPGCNSRFDSALFREHLPAYRDAQRRFAQALDSDTRSHLAVRPYSRTAASERTFWRAAAPDVAFVEGPLAPRLETARLVVIDHPGTTFLMTLAAGIPTVAFWDRDVWRLAVSAAPETDALREAGILFADPESAAAHVNRVSRTVGQWWDAAGTQQALHRFTSKLARHSHDWLPAWRAALSGEHA